MHIAQQAGTSPHHYLPRTPHATLLVGTFLVSVFVVGLFVVGVFLVAIPGFRSRFDFVVCWCSLRWWSHHTN